MYATFNDSTGSSTNAPTEIRSVNYATGAVGPLMGATSYLIKKGAFYGTAALAVDPVTKRFMWLPKWELTQVCKKIS
jgi:hypothetical protein